MERYPNDRFTNELAILVPTTPLAVTCKSCGADFVLPPDEQLWYLEKFDGAMPTHCLECRKQRRKQAKRARRDHIAALRAATKREVA